MTSKLVLASGSPQRQVLLESLGYEFSIVAPDIDETQLHGELELDFVSRLARSKAEVVRQQLSPGSVVVGADSIVVVGDDTLGKPTSVEDAFRMLALLSGTTHEVLTGWCVTSDNKTVCDIEKTKVKFRNLSSDEINWYIESGEPFGGAGACRIQGRGAAFVDSIEGSFSNVVGLPLSPVFLALSSFGVMPDVDKS